MSKIKDDTNLEAEFTQFQYDFHDLLKPYFEALGWKGERALERYKALYREKEAESQYDSKVGGYLLYACASSFAAPLWMPLSKKFGYPSMGLKHATYKQKVKQDFKCFFNRCSYKTQKVILQKTQDYKEGRGAQPF